MLDQSINTLENSTSETTSTTVLPQVTPSNVTSTLAKNPFDVPILTERPVSDMHHGCMVRTGGIFLASVKGGDLDIVLDSLTIQPLAYLPYDRLKLNTDKDSEVMAWAYNGITEVEGVEWRKEDYLEEVRKTFPKATWENRGCVIGRYITSELLKGGVAPLTSTDFVAVNLSPSSAKAWKAFVQLAGFNIDSGFPIGNCVELTKQDKSTKKVSWSQFGFNAVNVDFRQLITNQNLISGNAA